MKSYKLWLWIILAVLTAVLVVHFTPVRSLFSQELLTEFFRRSGDNAPVIFLLVSIVAIALGFPGNILAICGGALFGWLWGSLLSWIGATLGAIGAFWLARSLLRRQVDRWFGQHPLLTRLNAAIDDRPLNFVLAIRFTPISPFSLVNFLFGLTPIDLKTYVLGTVFGIIPITLTHTWLGVAGKQAIAGGDRLPILLALGGLAILSLLPFLTQKTISKKSQTSKKPEITVKKFVSR
jgi:uncharacterized membrane protein YdjX (TVP38/TMEM64 family)